MKIKLKNYFKLILDKNFIMSSNSSNSNSDTIPMNASIVQNNQITVQINYLKPTTPIFEVKSHIDFLLNTDEDLDEEFLQDKLERFNERLSERKSNRLIFTLYYLSANNYYPFFCGESEFDEKTTFENIKKCATDGSCPRNSLWINACAFIRFHKLIDVLHFHSNIILQNVTECEAIMYKNNLIQNLSVQCLLVNKLEIGRTYFVVYDGKNPLDQKYIYTGSTTLTIEERWKYHSDAAASKQKNTEAGNLYPFMRHIKNTNPLLINNFTMNLAGTHLIESWRELRCFEQINIDKCKIIQGYIMLNLQNSVCLRTEEEKKVLQAERSKRWSEKNREHDNELHRNWSARNRERSQEIKKNSREKLKDIYVHTCLYCPSKTGKPMRRDGKTKHELSQTHNTYFNRWHATYNPQYQQLNTQQREQFINAYNSMDYLQYEAYEKQLRASLSIK